MPDKDTTSEPTSKELELLRKLRANPILVDKIDLVMERFEQELANGSDAHQAEEAIIELLQNLGQNMMTQWARRSSLDAETQAREQDPTLQKHAKKKLQWQTTFGPIELSVVILRQRRRGRTLCPFKKAAGLTARSCSRPLQRRAVDFYAERSGEKTIAALQEHYGITLSLHAIQTITHQAAQKAKELNSQSPAKETSVAATLITQVDGSMVPIIEFGEVDQTGDHRKVRQSCWKEIRLCTVKAVGRTTTRYGVARGTPLEVGCMMFETCRFEGMDDQTHIHGVADGAPWIADQFEVQFGTRHNLLIDFYHVCLRRERCP